MADSNAKYGVLAQQQQGPPPANAPAYVHAHQEIGVSSAPHQHQHQMIYSQQGQAGGGYMQAPVQYNVANNYNTPAGAPASHSAHHPQQYIPTPHQYQPTGSSPGGAVPVQSAGGYSGAAYTGDEGGGCGGCCENGNTTCAERCNFFYQGRVPMRLQRYQHCPAMVPAMGMLVLIILLLYC